MTGSLIYWNGVPVTFRSWPEKMVCLSTTEAELNVAVMGVHDALFMKPMLASIGNGGSVGIGNNWSVGGRTCHIEVKQNFLQEVKQAGIIEFQLVSTANNKAELAGPVHTISILHDCSHAELLQHCTRWRESWARVGFNICRAAQLEKHKNKWSKILGN